MSPSIVSCGGLSGVAADVVHGIGPVATVAGDDGIDRHSRAEHTPPDLGDQDPGTTVAPHHPRRPAGAHTLASAFIHLVAGLSGGLANCLLAGLVAGVVVGDPDPRVDALDAVDEQDTCRRDQAGRGPDRSPRGGIALDPQVDLGVGPRHGGPVHRRPVIGRPRLDRKSHRPIMDSRCDK